MILAGGPARETESAVFGLHREGLEAQGDVEIRHEVVPDPGGHRWGPPKIRAVAEARQRFMQPEEPLFMVDTDVICGPGVLERMQAVDADVVFGVFWTHSKWGGYERMWPQVWDTHPYKVSPDLLKRLDAPGVNEIEVLGGGACTLIRGRGFESRYWPLPESLNIPHTLWYGEDRAFSLGCELRDIKMVAVTGLPIVHLQETKKTPITQTHIDAAREFCGL